jgi:hypothetical protein
MPIQSLPAVPPNNLFVLGVHNRNPAGHENEMYFECYEIDLPFDSLNVRSCLKHSNARKWLKLLPSKELGIQPNAVYIISVKENPTVLVPCGIRVG